MKSPANSAVSDAERPSVRFAAGGAWLCHRGRVRSANEDACLAGPRVCSGGSDTPAGFSTGFAPWMVAVSDGIGGHRGGAEASRTVVSALAAAERVTPAAVTSILRRVNRELGTRGRQEPDLAAMGATVAGLACGRRGLFAFHVGDSRVYRQTSGGLSQITRDDSEAEELIEQGLLTAGDAARPAFLHMLTQAIGGRRLTVKIDPHIHPIESPGEGRFLICTDGLTDMIAPSLITRIMLAEPKAKAAASALFEAAMNAGGMDNITIAVVEIRER